MLARSSPQWIKKNKKFSSRFVPRAQVVRLFKIIRSFKMGDKVRLLRFQLAPGNRLSLTGNFIKARIAHYPFPWPIAADVFRNSKRPSACVLTSFGKTRFWATAHARPEQRCIRRPNTESSSCAPATACISPCITLRNATRLQCTF